LCLIILSPARLCAQNDPCANPKPKNWSTHGSSRSLRFGFRQTRSCRRDRFRDELIKLLRQISCLVRDVGVFGDPELPALKEAWFLRLACFLHSKTQCCGNSRPDGSLEVLLEQALAMYSAGSDRVRFRFQNRSARGHALLGKHGRRNFQFEASTSGLGSTKTPEGKSSKGSLAT